MEVSDFKKALNEKGLSTVSNKQKLIDCIINCSKFSVLNFEKIVLAEHIQEVTKEETVE